MKTKFSLTILVLMLSVLQTPVAAQMSLGKPGYQSKHKIKKWFNKKEWLNGADFIPHNTISKTEFARQYHLNKVYWDKAFIFLKERDLKILTAGKYPIDGTNVFATITEDPSKDFDKTQWESHRKYIDLQCVINGEEKMGKYSFWKLTITKPYDETKDVSNYSGEGKIYTVPAGTFMIFFPADAHRPNITPGGNKVVKKIVIKILAAQ
jgi:biofilm protein TabA